MWRRIFLLIILLALAGAILGYFFIYNKPHADYEGAKPGFTGEAEWLYGAFQENPEAAMGRFDDMVLQVSGSVSRVEVNRDVVTVVFLFGEGFFGDEGVRCTMLDSHQDKALRLKEGQVVTIKGHFAGFDGSDVVLQHASIVDE
jgi:hypothetical protein